MKSIKWLTGFLLSYAVLMLSACTITDPSVNDLKSPCVSTDIMRYDNSTIPVPCERRRPVQNYTYIA